MGREDGEPHRLQPDPPEGDRGTIERELERQDGRRDRSGAEGPDAGSAGGADPGGATAPGDQARPGTPGTGENVCPDCRGTGLAGGQTCTTCGGTGKVVDGIGGA